MKIDVFCNDGSPLKVIPPDVYGWGVGGAELAMITWAETMVKRGHQVRIYNDPEREADFDGVSYLQKARFIPGDSRDVFIAFRSPNQHLTHTKAGMKIHWSCDQWTVGNFATDIFPHVDRVVCISPFHVNYHRIHYGIEPPKIGYIDLGVRLQDYSLKTEKIEGRCIFCSVPDRGLKTLARLWPKIKEQAPYASLVITSDYRLWGKQQGANNHQHRMQWLHLPDVAFLGKVERHELARQQAQAVCMPYPMTIGNGVVEELFCISAAECQVAGAIPVTTTFGALQTTNQWGVQIGGLPIGSDFDNAYVQAVVDILEMKPSVRKGIMKAARERFDWDSICERWERLITEGVWPA